VDGLVRPHRSRHGLIVLDDVFPHFRSPFRIAEYGRYLQTWSDAVVYSSGRSQRALDETRGFAAVRRDYLRLHPERRHQVREYHPGRRVRGKLAYTMFVQNFDYFEPYLERHALPFVFTLYPGGGFGLALERSDRTLERIFASPLFRHVICTQRVTRDYLLERGLCPSERIELVYGGVFPTDHLTRSMPKRQHYKLHKRTLDVCFVAVKYMPRGRDKGYDTFIEMAKRISRAHHDVAFHVVGPFDASDVEVEGLEGRLTFYGSQPTDFFSSFYARMDLIVSPNVPFVLAPGAFDGFPTGCCIEAGVCGTVVVCSDPLGLNLAFEADREIVIVPPDVDALCERIDRLHADPVALVDLSVAGQAAFQRVFDVNAQMGPRLRLLGRYLDD